MLTYLWLEATMEERVAIPREEERFLGNLLRLSDRIASRYSCSLVLPPVGGAPGP